MDPAGPDRATDAIGELACDAYFLTRGVHAVGLEPEHLGVRQASGADDEVFRIELLA